MLAQSPSSSRLAPDAFTREVILRQFETQHAQDEAEVTGRRDAQYRERQFIARMNRFVLVWSRFVAAYNDRNTFDLKSAKELSKAFHELENGGNWPRPGQK